MDKKFEYTSVLVKGSFNGIYVQFPFDSRKEFGTGKPVRVKATFEGREYVMNLLPNGSGGHWLHLKKEIRDAIGKQEGDDVHVTVQREYSKPEIMVPEYLEWLLNEEPEMKQYFNRLPVSGKKFWIGFIEETKNEDSKVERINRFFEFLQKQYSGKI